MSYYIQPKSPIRKKLLNMMLLVSFSVAFVGYIGFSLWYITSQYQTKVKLAETVVDVLSQNIAKLILLDSVNEATDITTILQSYKDINSIILYTKEGKIIYTYAKKDRAIPKVTPPKQEYIEYKNNHIIIAKKALYQEMLLGYMIIDIQMKSIFDILIKDLPILLTSLFLLFVVSYLLSRHYAKIFTYPILKLIRFLEKIKLQDIQKQHLIQKNSDDDEFAILYEKTNEMLERIAKANEEQRIASATFEIDNAIAITDKDLKILKVNKAYTKITHYEEKDVIGNIPPVLQNSIENSSFYKHIIDTLKEDGFWSGEIRNRTKEGEVFYEHLSIYTVINDENEIEYYIFSFSDITKQKNIEAKLRFLQQYDSLTGLPNKQLALSMIEKNFHQKNVLFCFDVRNFKKINEAYGFEVGDRLLKNIAQRVQENLEYVFFSRLENNRFLLSINYPKDVSDIVVEANIDAEYLIALLSKPFLIDERLIYINIAVGITFPNEEKSAQDLIDEVNTAVEYAKEQDISPYFFNAAIQYTAKQHIELYSNLVEAIKKKEFVLYYQLQFDKKKKPYGAEALIRWIDLEKGMIPPNVFIPLAEKTGLIVDIGKIVLELAAQQLQKWQKDPKHKDLTLSINIGSKHFVQDDFVEDVKSILQQYDVDFTKVQLELTEYLLVDDPQKIIDTMQQLKELGIRISIDDFGTGYSSLQYLRNLPLDELKIDRTFVKNAPNSKADKAVIASILALSQILDIKVIAEGIETEEEYDLLRFFGCEHFQGYLFAKPLDESGLEEFLSSY